MKVFLFIAGIVLVVLGIAWILHGVGFILLPIITGHPRWLLFGALAVVGGAFLIYLGRRRR